ncbi:uncharacterized protein LOC119598372 [Penaeus monodon]|uniref:uncharacterized protein LOC119598372 n=1 Tax=Penaeus monodon TaxID=6687 RepID=UPI0018A7329E|nr:uncharacterized protein LOC119598372 [Penaeus monodon]
MNENGQRLLELCCYHDLCITNTFFATKPLNCVLTTRSYHSADCDTDHSMQKGRPRINTSKTAIPDLCERFANSIEDALKNCPGGNTEERWSHIRDFIYNSAMDTFGKRERQNPDWFEAGIAELEPAIEAKRAALINYKREPSVKSLAALKAKNDAQRIVRRCANDHWLNLCESIQLSADCGNIRGPSVNKIAPLKSTAGDIITDRSKQMERWAEHYQELYSRENVVTAAAAENTASLPVMEELDAPPSADKLSKAIDSLACGKAPGKDGIPPEVIKVGKKTALLHHLHQLLQQCWEEGTVPQEMRDTNIITIQEQGRLHRNVQYDGSSSDPFSIKNGVKQGCVLVPTLFGIFFSLLLSYTFSQSEDGVYIHTRSDGSLFKLAPPPS